MLAAEDTFRHALEQSQRPAPTVRSWITSRSPSPTCRGLEVLSRRLAWRSRLRKVASQRVRAHFVPAGAALELEATADDSRSRNTRSGAPGFTTSRSRGRSRRRAGTPESEGVRLIDDVPRPGAHGSLAAFVHPSSTHGVLVELKEIKLWAMSISIGIIGGAVCADMAELTDREERHVSNAFGDPSAAY